MSCHKFSDPYLDFFADYSLELTDSQSPKKVILVQRGFWSGILSYFSAGLFNSFVKISAFPQLLSLFQKLQKISAENSKGVQILALYSVVYSHLLREF